MGRIHVQVAHPCNEVVQVSPNKGQRYQFYAPPRDKPQTQREGAAESGERNIRGNRGVKHPDDEWQKEKHDDTADAVQDGNNPGGR